jgi:hypothetical protein
LTVKATVSAISRIEGPGGKAYVPRERYSLMMSFCVVPARAARSITFSSATVA